MKETFKDIPGYENLYQVSNFGTVKSLERKVKHPKGGFKIVKERILKGIFVSQYLAACLYKEGDPRRFLVHQLVAMAFLGHKPDGYKLVINHKDFNKLNNNVDNLEIVTARENTNQKHLKSSSKHTGISLQRKTGNWQAQIHVNGKRFHLINTKNEGRASIAYDLALFQIKKLEKLLFNTLKSKP